MEHLVFIDEFSMKTNKAGSVVVLMLAVVTMVEHFHFKIVHLTESLGKKTPFAHPGRPHSLKGFPKGRAQSLCPRPLWPPEAMLFSDNFKRDLLWNIVKGVLFHNVI